MRHKHYLFLILLLILSGCGAGEGNSEGISPTTTLEIATTTPLAAGQSTQQPTAESTQIKTQNLVLWWPEPLAPTEFPEVTDTLSQQISAFDTAEVGEIEVQFRLKSYTGVGGILSTLNTASTIAPGAMPDLTLVRQEDLAALVQAGIVYPLEGIVPSAIIGDLYDPALDLGQINGQIYGLPYTLDIILMTHRSENLESTWTFDEVLNLEQSIAIPAGKTTTLNDALYLQYLNAGGTPPNPDGTMQINSEALETVLTFYQDAVAANIISEEVLNYTSPGDYLVSIENGSLDIGLVTSSEYLHLHSQDPTLKAIAIPTASGQPITILNGWMWVMTTNNPDRQQTISRFLSWMMDINRQKDYAETLKMLPSQHAALTSIQNEQYDISLFDLLINNAILSPQTLFGHTIQEAFIKIIQNDTTAQDTIENILESIEN